MTSYSFLNIVGAITGPGGATPIGVGSANADGGIKTSMKEEKNLAKVSADGSVMQVLRGGNLGRITVHVQKTSPINAILSAMYNFQRNNAAGWGTNAITFNDIARGDVVSGSSMAFVKFPDVGWDKDASDIEWEFEGNVVQALGAGANVGII